MYKYHIIVEELTTKIQNDELSSGEKVPSIRQLSHEFSCSKQTVSQALKILEQQHLIYSKDKSGYYVVEKIFDSNEEQIKGIDFRNASPNWSQFPYTDFQHCINRAFDTYQKDLFCYNLVNGLKPLVKAIQKLLFESQVFSKEENIFITTGVQQALNILCLMPFPNEKKTVLVEDPTYPQIIELIRLFDIPTVCIPRTNEKLDMKELERMFIENDIKFFYITPRFQNPLGFSLSKKEKLQIVDLASKHNVYIVEDDYMADFDINPKNDPLYSYDTDDKVIYLKSFSKIIFPGLRIGVSILPPLLSSTFREYKRNADIGSSVFSQAALEIYISSGMYKRHLKTIRDAYVEKTENFVKAVNEHSLSTEFGYSPPLALKTHLRLPQNINENMLINICKAQNVYLMESGNYYLDKKNNQDHYLLIELSNLSIPKIQEGTTLLLDTLKKLVK